MTQRQVISAWVCGILWATTHLRWYLTDPRGWGAQQFILTTGFWAVIAGLMHVLFRGGDAVQPWQEKERAPADTGKALSSAKYFTVSVRRFAFYQFASLGLWLLYWYYRNWAAINRSGYKKNISPAARSFFHPVTVFSLLKKILQGSQQAGYKGTFNPGVLAVLLAMFRFLPRSVETMRQSPGSLEISFSTSAVTLATSWPSLIVAVATPLILASPIQAIQDLKVRQGRDPGDDNRLTVGQVLLLSVGLCLWAVSIKSNL